MVGPPRGALGWISLTEQARAVKEKAKDGLRGQTGREKEREKFETGRDIFLISGDMNH